MPPADRSAWRNVHIFDSKDPLTVLGGLHLTNGITNANFYSMVEILFIFETAFLLRDEGDDVVQRDASPHQLGNYYIHANGMSYIVLFFVN
jgi:hypothetical protein